MLSIIITTKDEARSLKRALKIILQQARELGQKFEIIVVTPDSASAIVVMQAQFRNSEVKLIKDQSIGKPAALNLALQKAQGDFLVFTDGDVAWKNVALKALMAEFNAVEKDIGAVSGQPISLNKKNNIFGFWAKVLVESAHKIRMSQNEKGEYFPCSGYLYAIKRKFLEESKQSKIFLKIDLLAEDGYISKIIWENDGKIAYASQAKVMVKFPANFSDWKKQKIRTLAGYMQLRQFQKSAQKGFHRSFLQEAKEVFYLFSYAKNFQQILWTIFLIFARLYVWILAWWKIAVIKMDANTLWQRIESTK